jgi:hypothetical protein
MPKDAAAIRDAATKRHAENTFKNPAQPINLAQAKQKTHCNNNSKELNG